MSEETQIGLQALWQSQPVAASRFSAEEIRDKAVRFQRALRFRNLREYAAAACVLVVFGGYAWQASTWLSKAGPALVVLGTLYIVYRLSTRAASRPVPGGEDGGVTESCLRFHRRELERQLDLLRTVGRWYLAPLVPGLFVMFLDRFVEAWARGGIAVAVSLGSALVVALVFVGIWRLNVLGTRKLQRELEVLGLEQAGE